MPFGLLVANDADLVLRFGLRHEVVDASFARDRCRRKRIVAGDHDRLDAHAAELVEPLAHTWLDCVLEIDDADNVTVHHQRQRRAPFSGDTLHLLIEVGWPLAIDGGGSQDRVRRALEVRVAILAHAAHARLSLERDHLGARSQSLEGRCAELLREGLDAAPLRRVVAQARLTSGDQRIQLGSAANRDDLGCQSVAVGDRARLVQQQHVHITSRFDGATRHGQNVEARHAVHARNSDGRQQSANRRRDQTHQQGDQNHG